nr:MAG TPA: hypothetical protein [Caudoviricetes sp.]
MFNQNDGCFKQPLVTAKVRTFFQTTKTSEKFFLR